MLRKRLTREESRAQTREHLLDAALELFVKAGIDATSIEDVSEAAGYSRGAFYSNFDSKEDLICAVLQREIDREHSLIDGVFARSMAPKERLELIRAFYLNMACDLNGCMFWMAMQLYALRNAEVRPRIVDMLRSNRAVIIGYVRRVFEELGKEPPASPEVMAFSLIAQAQGFAISRMLDPDSIRIEQSQQVLGLYFDRLVGL